jgi:hypothetical protein
VLPFGPATARISSTFAEGRGDGLQKSHRLPKRNAAWIDGPLIYSVKVVLGPLPALVEQRPLFASAEACCSTAPLETRNLRKVAGVPPGRPAQIAFRCEAGVERFR